jgi:hypothetical protein
VLSNGEEGEEDDAVSEGKEVRTLSSREKGNKPKPTATSAATADAAIRMERIRRRVFPAEIFESVLRTRGPR